MEITYLLKVSSPLYGTDTYGPYEAEAEAIAAKERIKKNAVEEGTRGLRRYRIKQNKGA